MEIKLFLNGFNHLGLLPPGDYELTIDQIRESFLVQGPTIRKFKTNWDVSWRNKLLQNLEILVSQLNQVGINDIFVNGSFVEDYHDPQ